LHLSGDISEEIIVEPYHHLVCDDDVTFVPGSRLEIQPNAVVRIAPGADLTIMGNFKAQGEEDNMFWVTTNDGFADDSNLKLKKKNVKLDSSNEPERNDNFTSSILNFTFNRDSDLGLYNSMQLSPLATVEDDLIEWGKWDWGNTCLLNQVDNLTMQNGVFRNGSRAIECNSLMHSYLKKNNLFNFIGNQGSIKFNFVKSGLIGNNIIIESTIGMYLDNGSSPDIINNYINTSIEGMFTRYGCLSLIKNNFICSNSVGISIRGSCNEQIERNKIIAANGIDFRPTGYAGHSSFAEIHFNNIDSFDFAIKLLGSFSAHNSIDIDAVNNFFYRLTDIESIIFDKNDLFGSEAYNYTGTVIFEPFLMQEVSNAGIIVK
jgi:hypothetical protein